MREATAKIARVILVVTNVLILVLGCFTLGFGIFAKIKGEVLSDLITKGNEALGSEVNINIYSTSAVIIIVASCFTIFISFIGCYAALKEVKCILVIYLMIIGGLFVLMIIGGAIGFKQGLNKIKEPLKTSLVRYNENSTDLAIGIKRAWDAVQRDYHCCGVDGYDDWKDNINYGDEEEEEVPAVPESCCSIYGGTELNYCVNDPGSVSPEIVGCIPKFLQGIEARKREIIIVVVSIVVVMVLNMFSGIIIVILT